MVNRNVNQAEVKQRFSLRKLKIGTVSVLLGATFFLLGGNGSVKADTANPGSATVQVSASHQEQVNNQQQTQDAIKLVQQDATFTGTPQVFTIVFKHLTTPVTPDNPNVPRTVALYAAAGADQAQDEDGLYYDLVQGNKIIAKGLTKDQAWAKLAEIVSPEIVGYHLVNNKQKVIDDLIADAQANRHTVYTVYYTRDQQPTPTPAPGETPTTTPAETPVTPETTGHETATPVGGVQTGRTALVSATTTKQAASATQLPQTGTQAGRESVLGLGVAMLTTLFGLLGIKKREY